MNMVGGWTLPLWKIWVRKLGWWNSQYTEKTQMFQTTNQSWNTASICLYHFMSKKRSDICLHGFLWICAAVYLDMQLQWASDVYFIYFIYFIKPKEGNRFCLPTSCCLDAIPVVEQNTSKSFSKISPWLAMLWKLFLSMCLAACFWPSKIPIFIG